MGNSNDHPLKKHDTSQLQFLRFISFIFIFLFHADAFVPRLSDRLYLSSAITFFFVLSGFVSAYSSWNRDLHLNAKSVFQPMWKRVKKFYPLYLLTTLIALSYSDILNTIAYHNFNSIKGLPTKFLECLLLIQSWFPTGYFSFNGVGWFLSTLLFLSLLNVPVVSFVKNNKKKVVIICTILVVLADFSFHYLVRGLNNEFWNYIFPPARLGDYIIGLVSGCAFRSYIDGNKIKKNNSAVFFTLLEIFALAQYIFSFFSKQDPAWFTRDIKWLPVSVFLIVVFAFGKGLLSKVFRNRILVFLGNLSFECYILHQVTLWVFLSLCHIRDVSQLGNAVGITMTLSMILLASWLLHGRPMLDPKNK